MPQMALYNLRPKSSCHWMHLDEYGNLVRKAGIMGVVLAGGEVRPGDPIRVELPPPPHRPLAVV